MSIATKIRQAKKDRDADAKATQDLLSSAEMEKAAVNRLTVAVASQLSRFSARYVEWKQRSERCEVARAGLSAAQRAQEVAAIAEEASKDERRSAARDVEELEEQTRACRQALQRGPALQRAAERQRTAAQQKLSEVEAQLAEVQAWTPTEASDIIHRLQGPSPTVSGHLLRAGDVDINPSDPLKPLFDSIKEESWKAVSVSVGQPDARENQLEQRIAASQRLAIDAETRRAAFSETSPEPSFVFHSRSQKHWEQQNEENRQAVARAENDARLAKSQLVEHRDERWRTVVESFRRAVVDRLSAIAAGLRQEQTVAAPPEETIERDALERELHKLENRLRMARHLQGDLRQKEARAREAGLRAQRALEQADRELATAERELPSAEKELAQAGQLLADSLGQVSESLREANSPHAEGSPVRLTGREAEGVGSHTAKSQLVRLIIDPLRLLTQSVDLRTAAAQAQLSNAERRRQDVQTALRVVEAAEPAVEEAAAGPARLIPFDVGTE
jgi:hypothetical protein